MELRNLADLHVHLGATTSPSFLWELAHSQGIRLPEKNYWKFIELVTIRKKIPSKQYLKKISQKSSQSHKASPFELTHTIQSSPFAVEACIHHAISDAYRNGNMDQIEIRFNPMFRNRNGEHDLDKVLLAAVTGMKKACIEYPIKAGIILETDRQFTEEQHMIIAKKAVEFKGFGIVGMDISGPSPDSGFNIQSFVKAAEYIHSHDMGLTIHTGEFTDHSEIRTVIDAIKPDRIGHGIRAIRDPNLLDEISRKKIILELCPTSNIKTGIVKSWIEFADIIDIFKKHNVLFTVNSDGPQFLDTDVKKELTILFEKKILTSSDISEIIDLGHTSSFIKS